MHIFNVCMNIKVSNRGRLVRHFTIQFFVISDNYFSVSTDGTITVAKKLPRTNLYNTGTANLEVIVEDRGIPVISTSVNVQITVDSKYLEGVGVRRNIHI